jgi:peptidyl-dipeptidase A
MTISEMQALLDGFVRDTKPLYDELHLWTRRHLAKRYGAPVPQGAIPAHWINNRWSQNWTGIVEAADLDPYFAGREPSWIVKTAEAFYTSMGFEQLPPSFWEKSDLYPVSPGESRKKNSHASAWHIDLEKDVRSLMSVEPDTRWFLTTHHELGHIYYYLSYTRPEVPPILRAGANRAFHEGIGELISIASHQTPYLKGLGIVPREKEIDPIPFLLNEALGETIPFIAWSAGVISRWEADLYEKNLPPAEWNRRWWSYVKEYQGIEPPGPRGDEYCDPATKTHINDDPAQYYDYAIATVLKYQLHEHIARKVLGEDPRACNYQGRKDVGEFLKSILREGASRPWREVLRAATGEDLSTRAMMAYFEPLREWLRKENSGA